jgi:hypothetical protein
MDLLFFALEKWMIGWNTCSCLQSRQRAIVSDPLHSSRNTANTHITTSQTALVLHAGEALTPHQDTYIHTITDGLMLKTLKKFHAYVQICWHKDIRLDIFSFMIHFYIGWRCHISLVTLSWIWDLCQRNLKLANRICAKTSVLMAVALNYDLGLRYAEHHHLLCAYGRRRCAKMPGWTILNGVGGLELMATSYNATKV